MSRFLSGARVSAAVFALAFSAGCGNENSVVGGRCADGLKMSAGSCVASAPEVTLITPADPPSGQFAPGAFGAFDAPQKGEAPGTTALPPTNPDPITEPPSGHEIGQLAPEETAPIALPPSPPLPPPLLVCAAPQVSCRGICIPVHGDPMNCGACNKWCPSNICVDGECQGATPGDVVLIGHDYRSTMSGSAQSKILVNALSIPTTDPIRVLSYEEGADWESVAETKAIAQLGMPKGRKLRITRAAGPNSLGSASLSKNFDVVLIHGASAGDPVLLGASWATSLGAFATKGGVVVAIDNGVTPMPELLTSAGLLAIASHTTQPGATHLLVAAAQDVVGAQVPSPYAAFGMPVSFQGIPAASDDLTWVVRAKDSDGAMSDPVVVHRVVR